MTASGFRKYFSLEEAVSALPLVKDLLADAHREVDELRGSAILYKRIVLLKQESGQEPSDAEVEALHRQYEGFEKAFVQWVERFAEHGIILRDLETGLIDFPYRSRKSGQDFLLCWRLNEDGIFYFHGLNDGFAGRHPISLLPD